MLGGGEEFLTQPWEWMASYIWLWCQWGIQIASDGAVSGENWG